MREDYKLWIWLGIWCLLMSFGVYSIIVPESPATSISIFIKADKRVWMVENTISYVISLDKTPVIRTWVQGSYSHFTDMQGAPTLSNVSFSFDRPKGVCVKEESRDRRKDELMFMISLSQCEPVPIKETDLKIAVSAQKDSGKPNSWIRVPFTLRIGDALAEGQTNSLNGTDVLDFYDVPETIEIFEMQLVADAPDDYCLVESNVIQLQDRWFVFDLDYRLCAQRPFGPGGRY